MNFDQNQPGSWIATGAALLLIGAAVPAASGGDDPGIGRFLVIAGVVLVVVGMLIFVIRAGTSRGHDDDR